MAVNGNSRAYVLSTAATRQATRDAVADPRDLGIAPRLLDAEAEGTLYAMVVSGNVDVVVPWACELCDMTVICTAAHASGTIQAKQGSNVITDAVICAVAGVVTRVGSIAQTGANFNIFAAGAKLTLVTANTPAGKVTLNFKKYQTSDNSNPDGT